ncbi:MAG: uncharacterized protein A8A55_2507 [Amphiamblys sp. WSBS2006]|nr:MAG: uncharacterized protein A8A55_2507 [Amphiamblys sp. WSBS2006]
MENLQEQTSFLQNTFFARYKNKYFVEINDGLLIVPKIAYEHPEEVKAREQSLFKLKQRLLEASGRSDAGAVCMICSEGSTEEVFLFPTSREANHFVCLDCLKKEAEGETKMILYPDDREDPFAVTEYRRICFEHREEWKRFLKELVAQPPHIPDEFSLTTTIPNKKTLLTEQTTVSLENIAISATLFFVLLSKTKVRVGENLSLFGEEDGEDCIEEHDTTRNTPVLLRKNKTNQFNPSLFLENISNIPSKSIACTYGIHLVDISTRLLSKLKTGECGRCNYLSLEMEKEEHLEEILPMEDRSIFVGEIILLFLMNYAVSILSKLAFHEDNEMAYMTLEADREDHIRPILDMENRSIFVEKIKERIIIRNYAVTILPKLRFHEDNETYKLFLFADQENHIRPILAMEDRSIFIGKIRKTILGNYAVSILSKLGFHEDNEMASLSLFARQEDHIRPILAMENRSIVIGKVEGIIRLEKYAVTILPKLRFHEDNETHVLFLLVDQEDHIRPILDVENRSIFVGKVKSICPEKYAHNILSKLRFHEDNETKGLFLHFDVEKEEYIRAIFDVEDRSIFIGEAENISLYKYAVNILPKLRFHERNRMVNLELFADEEDHIKPILNTGNRSIDIGGIKKLKLRGYAMNVLLKLKIGEDNEMEEFYIWSYMANILSMGDGSIEVGRIKRKGFDVPEEIKPKLKYILVEEEGHEVETS